MRQIQNEELSILIKWRSGKSMFFKNVNVIKDKEMLQKMFQVKEY